MDIIGDAPKLISLHQCSREVYEQEGLTYESDFLVEGDADVPGGVGFIVKLEVKSYLTAPVTLNITVSAIRTRLRLCYSNQHDSFLQLIGSPKLVAEVKPSIGTESRSFQLQGLPYVTNLIKNVVDNEIAALIYPKRLVMSVPCTSEGIKIDKEGRRIA